ncbi:MAG: hypothetical protein HC892_07215 [Saprospiraceae bacterium]|nr:hypothetical protein [Saprospiraceae bacterium]
MQHLILASKTSCFVFSLFFVVPLLSQDYEPIMSVIHLDSFVVTATRQGFDVKDFIELVQKDESFYQSFRNLRFLSYQSDNDIQFYDKSNQKIATYKSVIVQKTEGFCRTMDILSEDFSGNYFKKKRELRYYTAELYDRLFFTHGEVCESSLLQATAPKGMDKHIEQLKKLIFQPGEKVEVPIVGGKTAIFEPSMMPYYDYSISSKKYQNQIDCYVFSVKVKPEAKASKTIIKSLETYFDKINFQVIARDYQLVYQGTAFDFNVTMNIKLRKLGKDYVPEYVHYKGYWDIPTQKPEIADFSATFYNFK